MPLRRFTALLLLGGSLTGCGVRGNPRPALPDVHPLQADAGPAATSVPTPDAGVPETSVRAPDAGH
jgi:predicted small lipoprotein YifL